MLARGGSAAAWPRLKRAGLTRSDRSRPVIFILYTAVLTKQRDVDSTIWPAESNIAFLEYPYMLSHTPTPKRIRKLTARQRKKHHVGEFRELCFEVKIVFKQPLAEPDYDAWWSAVIDLIESRGLFIGGLGGRLPLLEADGIVVAAGRGSPSEEDRQAVLAGLQAIPGVARAEAGDLVDAWYGPFDFAGN